MSEPATAARQSANGEALAQPSCKFPLTDRILTMTCCPRLPVLLLCSCLLVPAGCGQGAASASSVAETEGSYETGLQAFQAGDFAAAESQLTAAITSGSLQPDLAEAALRLRARARTALGKTAEAEADLTELKQGAAEMDQYWLACAELELKKGNTAAAKDAVKQARSANSKVSLPKELEQLR